MTSPPDDTTADTSATIAALRAERDAALSEKAALAQAALGHAQQRIRRADRASGRHDRCTEGDVGLAG